MENNNSVDVTYGQLTEVVLRRTGKILLPSQSDNDSKETLPDTVLVAIQRKVEQFGYMFTNDALTEISKLSFASVQDFVLSLASALKSVTHAHIRPEHVFYKNFPEEVASMSEVKLYMDQMVHYFGTYGMESLGFPTMDIFPQSEANARPELSISTHVKPLEVFRGDSVALAVSLVNAGVSLSENDMDEIFMLASPDMNSFIEQVNPVNRENKAHLLIRLAHEDRPYEILDTATDVLRYIAGRGGNDVSLGESMPRIPNLPRPERKALLSRLDKMPYDHVITDFSRNVGTWKRIARTLHVGDYAKSYPNASRVFRTLAEGKVSNSFNRMIENLLLEKKWRVVSGILVDRPGEFARRLNNLYNLAETKKNCLVVLSDFMKVTSQIPTATLWQMVAFFENPDDDFRVIYPKGRIANAYITPRESNKYSDTISGLTLEVIMDAIKEQYSQKDKLGKVWIDPDLSNYAIPTGLRSASKSANAIPRGSRIKISDANFQRFYVWWKNPSNGSRTDVDLSAVFLNKDFEFIDSVSYHNLRLSQNADHNSFVALHSGDITNAPKGAVEYIDVDMKKAVDEGYRYLAMTINVYSGANFENLEVNAGMMEKNDQLVGELHDPKEVKNSFDVVTPSNFAMPFVIDLLTRELIWVDSATKVQSQHSSIMSVNANTPIRAFVNKRYASLGSLALAHAQSRGEVVSTKEEADVVWEMNGSLLPFTMDEIITNLL